MRLTQFVTKTQFLVDSLEEGKNWDQTEGTYSFANQWPCCIGAHLAGFFGVAESQQDGENSEMDFTEGARAACEFIGCHKQQLDDLLHAAGAPCLPFGGREWPIHPSIVWKNLALIEDLPPLDFPERQQWVEWHRQRFFGKPMTTPTLEAAA